MDSEPRMGPYSRVPSSTALVHSRRPSRDSPSDWSSRIVTWGCETGISAAPLAHYPLSIGFLVPLMYIGVPWVSRRIATSLFFFLSFSHFLRGFSLVRFTISRARVQQRNRNLSRLKNREIATEEASIAMCSWGSDSSFSFLFLRFSFILSPFLYDLTGICRSVVVSKRACC